MLRWGAQSSLARLSGYAIAVSSAALLGYALVVLTVAAATTNSTAVATWLLAVGALVLAAVIAVVIYVSRRPYSGGYFIVAIVCVVSSLVCFISLLPLIAW